MDSDAELQQTAFSARSWKGRLGSGSTSAGWIAAARLSDKVALRAAGAQPAQTARPTAAIVNNARSDSRHNRRNRWGSLHRPAALVDRVGSRSDHRPADELAVGMADLIPRLHRLGHGVRRVAGIAAELMGAVWPGGLRYSMSSTGSADRNTTCFGRSGPSASRTTTRSRMCARPSPFHTGESITLVSIAACLCTL